MRNVIKTARWALLVMLIGSLQAAEGWTKYNSKPGSGSKVRIDGTSTVHDWEVEGLIIGGAIETGPGFPTDPTKAQPGKVEAKLDVFIPVRSLKSMEGGKPYSNKMDDIMYEKLKEGENKRITYKLTELTVKEAAKSATDPILLESTGDLTVAGVTKKVTMPVQMKIEGNILRFSAKTTAKMSDFQVEPPAPAIAGGLIKTGDEIKLSVDWVTAAPKKP